MRRVLAFLGKPWCPAVLEPSADAARPQGGGGNHHKALFTSSIGRWKTELSREEMRCIQAIASDTMTLLGYEAAAI